MTTETDDPEVSTMLLADRKLRCPSCGAKNEADAIRCHTCTRQLPRAQMPSEAVFEEALYSAPVGRHRTRRGSLGLPTRILLVAAAIVALNYFFIGWGPDWAHRDLSEPGDSWTTQRTDDFRAVFPGEPERSRVPGPAGDMDRYVVWVDEGWDSVLDAGVVAPAARARAPEAAHAAVIIGVAPPGVDLDAQASGLVAALEPSAEITDVEVRAVGDEGTQVDVVGDQRGAVRPGSTGEVRARVITEAGRTFVLATWGVGDDDPDLQDFLVRGFSPGAAPAAPADAN